MWQIEGNLPIKLAVIELAQVQVTKEKQAFNRLNQCAQKYREKYKDSPIGEITGIQIARSLFRTIGIDPTKHRPSSEALLNRALKEKDFFAVNSLVDAGNWCSLDFLLPVCVYDADQIRGEVTLRIGRPQETYPAINGRSVNLHNRYLLADWLGPFGSPITDSKRSSVSLATKNSVLIIYAPQNFNNDLLQEHSDLFAWRAIEFSTGRLKSIQIIGKTDSK